MVKYDRSILVLVGGDHLFHGTNHRINLLVDFLKKSFRSVTIVSPNQEVEPTQELVNKINAAAVTENDLIFKKSQNENVTYLLIPPFLGYKDMPVLMKVYLPLLLQGQHFDLCYSHGVEMANMPKVLKESQIVDFTVYLDVDYTPGFEYGDEFKKAVMALEEISIESNDIVISVSEELAQLRQKKYPDKNIFASPNGVRYDLFATAQNAPRKEPIMIYTGWLGPTYGVQFPIYAMPRIVKEIPDAKYIIVGFGDEAYKKTLQHIAEDLGVEKNIIFYDKQPYEKLPEFLKQARVGIATFKDSEINQIVCPLKVFEYFAAGLPVIGANFGGLGRIMGESKGGIEISGIDDIALAAVKLFRDQNLFETSQKNAIQYAKNYDIDFLLSKELETVNAIFYEDKPPKKEQNKTESTCNICGSQQGFDLTNPEGPRESWVCRHCGSTSRDRMYIYALAKALDQKEPMQNWQLNKSFKILEAAGARAHPQILKQKFDYINTKYDPEVMSQPGYDFNTYVDFQTLRFANESYNVIMCSDVFEHIRLHNQALQEIHRVLKPGGVLVLTVPMRSDRKETVVRVQPEGDEDVYLQPPHYHAEHTLVYRDYGMDFIDEIRACGFEVELIEAEFPEYCISKQIAIIVRKPVVENTVVADQPQATQTIDNYQEKIRQETAIYENVTHVHDLPEIHGLYGREFLTKHIQEITGSTGYRAWWIDEITQLTKRLKRTVKILSLACGNGDTEIELLRRLNLGDKVSITGVDINPAMIERAKELAKREKYENAFFEVHDLNFLKLNESYDVILANHSLHHIMNLETMFEEIAKTASENMIFLINDMIGRNGHVMWENAAQVVDAIWNILEDKYKMNAYSKQIDSVPFNADCSQSGFEGIRAEDILPNLLKNFDIELFFPFSVILNRFVDRTYGHNFNVNNQADVNIIKTILNLDVKLLQEGKLAPTQAFIKARKKGKVKNQKWLFQKPEQTIEARKNKIRESDYLNELTDLKRILKKRPESVKVSIIIPVYNNLNYTQNCIKSILRHTAEIDYEIIIVDNSSTDGTTEYLKNLTDFRIKPIFNKENEGFVNACNTGAVNASGKFIVLLNNDTEVQPGWLTSLYQLAQEKEDCAAVGSKLVYPNGKLQEAGSIIFSDGNGWNFGRGLDPNDPRFNFVREVDYCSGAALMVNKEIWDKLGGLDSQYAPAYYEDTDLCFSVRKMGYKVYYQPHSVVIHHEGQTAGTDLNQGFKKYQNINRQKFVKKWQEELKLQKPNNPENVLAASNRNIKGSIFIADPFLPMYDRASGSLRLFNYVKILKELGFHITFLARSDSKDPRYKTDLQQMGVEVYANDEEALQALDNSLITSQRKMDYRHIFTERKFNYAILSFWDIAEYYLPIVKKYSPSTKIIIDTVDIHFKREIRQAELLKNQQLKNQAEARKKREIEIYKKADSLWVVTENDKKAIKQFVKNKTVDIIPNIHTKIDYQKNYQNSSDLLFVGNFNHLPNRDAVHFLCSEIMPEVRKNLPDVKLYIVGNNPNKEVIDLSSANTVVTGYVKDLTPYLINARISINPLRYGAGMKGKIGEALSWGLPVVTTSIGAEGMHLEHKKHALIADKATDFADHIVNLYQDSELWQTLSKEGKNLVQKKWSPQAVSQILQKIFKVEEKQSEKFIPQVSIIMLTYNALDYTKKCLASIQKHTQLPYEIIFVDNGSNDGTKKWLKAQVKKNQNIKLLSNAKNLGFAAGNNQGAKKASAKYLLFLNNDVEVSEGWLESLVRSIELDEKIGMVGPITNYISGLQQVKNVEYDNMKGFHKFAKKIRDINEGIITPRRRIAGFAMLMRKNLFDQIDGFDTSFGTGNFEDDDLCLRVREAGYALMVDESTFIHHYGSKSYEENKINYSDSLEERKKIFEKKWHNVNYNELLEIENPLIEKHEQQIKEAYDLLTSGNAESAYEKFKLILSENPISGEGLLGAAYCLRNSRKFDQSVFYLKKLIDLQPDNAIAYNQLGLIANENEDLDNAEFMFTQAISKDNTFVDAQRNYADVLIQKGDFESGIVAFQKILEKHPEDIPSLIYLAQLNLEAGRVSDCQELISQVKAIDPQNELALEMQTIINESNHEKVNLEEMELSAKDKLESGNYEEAVEIYQTIIAHTPDNVSAQYGLGLVYQLKGDKDIAKRHYQAVANLAPGFEDVYNNLGILELQQGNALEAIEYFQKVIQINPQNINAQINISDALIEMQQYEEGIQTLKLTLQDHPNEIQALLRMGNLYREAGNENEAASYFNKVLEIEPNNEMARAALA